MDREDDAAVPSVAVLNEGGPWGSGGGKDGGSGGDGGDRNPWNQPPRRKPSVKRPGVSPIDDILRRGRERFGGGGSGAGIDPDGRRLIGFAAAALVILWLLWTSIHRIDPQQRGVVTRLGSFSSILQPGTRLTFPAPFDVVDKIDVEDIRTTDIGSTSETAQNLVLTGDQNIIDLAYSVRWNIRDPELYLYELADPDDTVGEVAESAMRSEMARVSLNDAIGPQRSQIEARVAQRMQEVLDSYRAGIIVQGVAIKQADPPAAVNDAFKSVSAAQQTAQTYLNEARAYSQQLGAKAEGEAAAFDKVYAEYKLSPEVTRKRMYYETMERVLAKTDKTVVDTANGVVPYMPLPAPRGAPAQ